MGDNVTQEPKLWRDMTPEEKGALLLAHHEGQSIQSFGVFVPDMWCADLPEWEDKVAYRIKPEPKRETVTLYARQTIFGPPIGTIDLIDGKPDPASIKIEDT